MEITAKSESGFVISIPRDRLGRWVRPAKWHVNDPVSNDQEDKDRRTFNPEVAQCWADELARVCR